MKGIEALPVALLIFATAYAVTQANGRQTVAAETPPVGAAGGSVQVSVTPLEPVDRSTAPRRTVISYSPRIRSSRHR